MELFIISFESDHTGLVWLNKFYVGCERAMAYLQNITHDDI